MVEPFRGRSPPLHGHLKRSHIPLYSFFLSYRRIAHFFPLYDIDTIYFLALRQLSYLQHDLFHLLGDQLRILQ